MSVCLFVCVFVRSFVDRKTQKLMDRFFMKFGRMTDNDIGKNPLNFGHDPDHDPDPRSGRNTLSF